MKSVVLVAFPFAISGRNVEKFNVGDERDFEQHTESLTKKGYLAPVLKAAEAPPYTGKKRK